MRAADFYGLGCKGKGGTPPPVCPVGRVWGLGVALTLTRLLSADTETLDECAVAFDVDALEVAEQVAAATNENHQTTA